MAPPASPSTIGSPLTIAHIAAAMATRAKASSRCPNPAELAARKPARPDRRAASSRDALDQAGSPSARASRSPRRPGGWRLPRRRHSHGRANQAATRTDSNEIGPVTMSGSARVEMKPARFREARQQLAEQPPARVGEEVPVAVPVTSGTQADDQERDADEQCPSVPHCATSDPRPRESASAAPGAAPSTRSTHPRSASAPSTNVTPPSAQPETWPAAAGREILPIEHSFARIASALPSRCVRTATR